MKTVNSRTTKYSIDNIFLERYSSRAMSGEKITEEEIMTLFDASRWAPSASNSQPWRFIYAMRETSFFEKFFSFLAEGNKIWCKKASALVIVISKKYSDNGRLLTTNSFDTGSAWENLALQSVNMNLITHGMAGFDYDMAKRELSIPNDYNVEIMIAIGKPSKVEDLPEKLREREKPNDRKNLEELVFKGKFPS